ncbi:hypothetical protein C7S16_0229 [Burkholderia thailandensis]|uniref:Uncharacterized protein n=1 Tax=Burkholderia thailandensis TaxID=57975 RepID=A0AAW9D154_BURTH|nr:hypothetical protein [Burkholderia thailandensis]
MARDCATTHDRTALLPSAGHSRNETPALFSLPPRLPPLFRVSAHHRSRRAKHRDHADRRDDC